MLGREASNCQQLSSVIVCSDCTGTTNVIGSDALTLVVDGDTETALLKVEPGAF